MTLFAPAEFQKLTISDAMNLFGHNHDISSFSKYIRYVITEWLMNCKFNVNLLTVRDPSKKIRTIWT